MKAVLRWLKQMTCSHAFHYHDLVGRPTPSGNVTWPCRKCGRVFVEQCGLDVLSKSRGTVLPRTAPSADAGKGETNL